MTTSWHEQLRPYHAAGWRGVIHPGWAPAMDDEDPWPILQRWPGEVIRDRPAAQTLRVHSPAGPVFAKRITARKDHSRASVGWWHRLRWAMGPSVAARNARISRQLARARLGVPVVVLAARRRSRGGVEDLLVTEAAAGAPLSQLVERLADRPEQLAPLLSLAGRSVAALHSRGFVHGDLLPGNLLVSPDHTQLVYLDNDRTRRCWPRAPRRLCRRNLAQMLYRLLMPLRYRHARLFLAAYQDAAGLQGSAWRRERAFILRRVRQRLRRNRIKRRRT